MKKCDLTSNQQEEIKAIEKLSADIEKEAARNQEVPYLGKDWWKAANLDNFLVHKKQELEQMQNNNKQMRNKNKKEEGYCTVM